MRLRFHSKKTTTVRFFSSGEDLRKEWKKSCAFVWKDSGVPLHVSGLQMKEWKSGEDSKRWSQVELALEWLAENGAERSQRVAAMGGGAFLDFSAMAASLYRRGMGLVLVPSTLLGMVDASLGGKTAVDRTSSGRLLKNFAGTFYPADEVWIYPGLLSTLPKRERISGAAEVLKTLWIAGMEGGAPLQAFVETGAVGSGLSRLIRICLKTKAEIVEEDPTDSRRIRECLNYGHTVGHALESLEEGRLSHGEAVLWGMAVESGALGGKGALMGKKAREAAESFGLKVPGAFRLPPERWEPCFRADKKSRKGKIDLTVLEKPAKLKKLSLSVPELCRLVRDFPESARP